MDDTNQGWASGPSRSLDAAIRTYGRQVGVALGIAALAAGGTSPFLSSNGAGSAGLVAGGVALLGFVLLGDRLEILEVGNLEFHLRKVTREAADLEAMGDKKAARRLRAEAWRLPRRVTPEALAYGELRHTSPAGAQRIIEFNKVVKDTRKYARLEHPAAEVVREIFVSGGDGVRVYALALMREDPTIGDVDCILAAVLHTHSVFEQGQILQAAITLELQLGAVDRSRLSDALHQQLEPGGQISRSTDRRRLTSQLLEKLGD
jgi:hypothetical protein